MIWDASDANPMHRRIPAEVVSRRRAPHQRPGAKPEVVLDEVVVDVKSAIILKPEARAKWLSKACAMVERGAASSTDLYDVVTNRKFSGGLPARVGRKLATTLRESMTIFSDKQQRFLMSAESPLGVHFTLRPDVDEADDEDDEAPEVATEMLATAAMSGIQMKELAAARLQPPAGGQEMASSWQVAEDDATKRRLKALEEADKLEAKTKKKEEKKISESDRAKKAGKEEQKQKQLEEEADNLLGALVPGLGMAASAPPIFSSKADRRKASASRSRSISSRAARRHQREQKRKKEERDNSWRKGRSESGLSGSRALLLNRNYQDDLPHLPRHAASAANSAAAMPAELDRSESRSRSQRRRRRR
eukprot:TRINITY_DN79144_c0_g1_i1.p1 TRINITY_DN79144_c0_g1~~TRINITY_DN79144_c0_g1_i1.p1  ORF type:complete len:375 (-),score=77.64 TRINITY_DN79144_c0_g1_i1:123-1211(-)